MCKFRTLKPDEVELRVSQNGKKGGRVWAKYLIYKDARVDQNILDETVGSMRWQKSYEIINDRLYCTISIYDPELKEWISKQDVGTESNTEPDKGRASDAQKRAGFAWGIGRELYSAPDIFIELQDGEYTEKDGKIYPKGDIFSIQTMDVDEDTRKITKLTIIDRNLDVRFAYPKATKRELKTTNVERKHPSPEQLQSLAKRIAKGEDLTDKIQTHFLMSQEEKQKLTELINQYK